MKTDKRTFVSASLLSVSSALFAMNVVIQPVAAQEMTGRAALFQEQTPVEMMASNYLGFETGYLQPEGSVFSQLGSHQTEAGASTGTQIYGGRVDWALAERWQVGAFGQVYDDPPLCGLPTCAENLTMMTFGSTAKFSLMETSFLATSLAGSLEGLYLEGDLYNNKGNASTEVVGSLQLPISYTLDDSLRLHLTPGISILPDKVSGTDYYGTIPWIGGGLTFVPATGLQAYATVAMPLSGRGNVIAQDGQYKNIPIWNAGVRVGITPKAALDIFATNGWGTTPATSIIGISSNPDDIAFGLRLDYTPHVGAARRDIYFDTYRSSQLMPVTRLDEQRQLDGFTLASAETYSPGTFVVGGGTSTEGYSNLKLTFSPDQDLQLEAYFNYNPDDGTVGGIATPWQGEKSYMFGGKLRFMDQNYGDLISVSGQVLAGRNFPQPTVGILYASLPASYDVSDNLTLNVNPRGAVFLNETVWGVGGGINYSPLPGLQLIGEYSYVGNDGDDIWSIGSRYFMGRSGLSADIYMTNAATLEGVGTLMALDTPRYGIAAHFRF